MSQRQERPVFGSSSSKINATNIKRLSGVRGFVVDDSSFLGWQSGKYTSEENGFLQVTIGAQNTVCLNTSHCVCTGVWGLNSN